MNLTEHLDRRDAIAREAVGAVPHDCDSCTRPTPSEATCDACICASNRALRHRYQSDPTTSLLFSDVVRAARARTPCDRCIPPTCVGCEWKPLQDAINALHNHLEGRE